MFCSGNNRWDAEDYPEYADEEFAIRRLAEPWNANEPMLKQQRNTDFDRSGGGVNEGPRGGPSGGTSGGQFERKLPSGVNGSQRRGRDGVELTVHKYHRVGGTMEDVDVSLRR